MSDSKKMTVVDRLWDRDDGSQSGYLEFGMMGRLHIVALPNNQSKDSDSDMTLLMPVDNTPYGMLKRVSKNINEALFDDEENTIED